MHGFKIYHRSSMLYDNLACINQKIPRCRYQRNKIWSSVSKKKKKKYGAKADGKSDDRQENKFSLILESFIEINLLKCFHLMPFAFDF